MTSPVVHGYVLAGGESTRMQRLDLPRDKALALYEGETLLQRASRTLSEVCPCTSILCGTVERGERLGPNRRMVPDRMPFCGPLGGLDAALHDAANRGAEAILIMPVDMPNLSAELLHFLLEASHVSDAAVACLQTRGTIQPLPAYCQTSGRARVGAALAAGDRKFLPALRQIAAESPHRGGFLPVDADESPLQTEMKEWFVNVNTPADLQSAPEPETLGTRLHLSKHGG